MNSHGFQRFSVQRKSTPSRYPEEQRRIPDRQQAAAAVADEKDEEHERVGDVPALPIGLQERPDEQHGRARGADEARGDRTDAEEGRVHGRRGDEVALDPHAAGDHVQREQEDDERDVFREEGVGEHRTGDAPRRAGRRGADDRMGGKVEVDGVAVEEEVVEERHQPQASRDEQFAGIVLPPVGPARRERQDRDRREQQAERQHHGNRRGGPRMVAVRRLCAHQQIATMLRPAGHRGHRVCREQEDDSREAVPGRVGGVGVVHGETVSSRPPE